MSKGLISRLNEDKDFLSFKNLESLSQPTFQNLLSLPNPNTRTQLLTWAVSERFRRFLMGYSKAINKQQGRTGSLFQKNYKKKELDTPEYIRTAICYVHHNPIHHGFGVDYDQYKWCSYLNNLSHISDSPRPLRGIFSTREDFVTAHKTFKSKRELYFFNDLEIQDDTNLNQPF